LLNRPGGPFVAQSAGLQFGPQNSNWMGGATPGQQKARATGQPQRMPFERSGYVSGTASDRSGSMHEVENMLMTGGNSSSRRDGGWSTSAVSQSVRQANGAPRGKIISIGNNQTHGHLLTATMNRRPQAGVFRPALGIR